MDCKFCHRKARTRGLCALHSALARNNEGGLTPHDFNPLRKRIKIEIGDRFLTPVNSNQMVRLFATEFNELRKENKMSQLQLSLYSGVERTTLHRLENRGGNMRFSTFLQTVGTVPFGPALLRRLADRLEAMQEAHHAQKER